MRYIDLKAIQAEDVEGKWEVKDRHLTQSAEQNVFKDVHSIELNGGLYKSLNGKEVTGSWSIIREKEVIYNPQLKFFISDKQIANAIITRLRADDEGGREIRNLTLYFDNGLELNLQKSS